MTRALLAAALLVALSLVVPHSALQHVAQRFSWLGRGDAWLISVLPGWDLDHFAVFGALGLLAPLAGVRSGAGRAALVLLAVAALTELVQAWVPGRSPQVSDAFLDLAGGMMGYLLATALVRCADAWRWQDANPRGYRG